MEEKYKSKGLSDDEATVAAYQNIKTKKILVGVGALTLAAVAGYAAYKIHDDRVDKIIKSGTKLQNISADSTMGVRDAFYSSGNSLDNAKYKGLYGNVLKTSKGNAFKKEIEVVSDIRQASRKSAQDALSEIVKSDKGFANSLKDTIVKNTTGLDGAYTKKIKLAQDSLSKGIVDKNVYEVFNASLVNHSPEVQTLTDKFYNHLGQKGYNAIKDVNDAKYSGYKSINPLITFNSSGKVKVVDVKELVDKEIAKANTIARIHLQGSELAKQGAAAAAALLSVQGGAKYLNNNTRQTRISEYRSKNPNTKMTNTDIIRMLERGDKYER